MSVIGVANNNAAADFSRNNYILSRQTGGMAIEARFGDCCFELSGAPLAGESGQARCGLRASRNRLSGRSLARLLRGRKYSASYWLIETER